MNKALISIKVSIKKMAKQEQVIKALCFLFCVAVEEYMPAISYEECYDRVYAYKANPHELEWILKLK